MHASGLPPSCVTYAMAFTPGGRRDPDTIAANVSIRCCFVASRAVAGNGCSAARTMYSETVVMTGEMAPLAGFTASSSAAVPARRFVSPLCAPAGTAAVNAAAIPPPNTNRRERLNDASFIQRSVHSLIHSV
jgi:hypothetical protein